MPCLLYTSPDNKKILMFKQNTQRAVQYSFYDFDVVKQVLDSNSAKDMSFKSVSYTHLTIKGKGEMGDPIKTTVYENKNIKKVVIKKGFTAIADFAFKGCKKLKEIILPST